ncbi:NADH-quinone oxidoreductase subunit K [Porifericola rhodea]|uniref:NADH-quinone oxidoreductase subunit K n=1 Tax=Porifericola rhodea TaxID=930972 RepID=UPI002665FAA2|nr:NADH-quinone oxidoreductase subunit K [Porifericola rhodea]WKN31747.1 NADH-quinone oxidoreductase subunit K [Porifericola rhodea]
MTIITGVLYAAGVYLLMQRSFIKLVIGIILFAHASNFFLFTAGGITRAMPAFVHNGQPDVEKLADPLPQALILTAIVIGLGIQAFAIVLLKRVYHVTGTSDLDKLRTTDREEEHA